MDGINANIRLAQVLTVQSDMAGADRTLRETLRMGEQGPATGEYVVRNALAHAYYDAHADLLARMGDENQAIEQDLKLLDLAATQLARENRNRIAERQDYARGLRDRHPASVPRFGPSRTHPAPPGCVRCPAWPRRRRPASCYRRPPSGSRSTAQLRGIAGSVTFRVSCAMAA